jgi:geranylgeranyl diphosphate synthase type II
MNLQAYLAKKSLLVNQYLKRYLPRDSSLLSRAMRYSIFAGGKRLRPMLVLEAAELCGLSNDAVMPAACALEYIHTYSLIHDDLPAMDDDDLRRGKPTCHIKFGEATAILAGDALLTDAFRLVSKCAENKKIPSECVIQANILLSSAAGYNGMIGGQMKDTIETDGWDKKSRASARKSLEYIHLNKTAALLRASLLVGATLAGGTKKQLSALDNYGRDIGLAFQIADDILDITADKKLLGKRGSDRENNKLTYPALYGLDASRAMATRLIQHAKKSVSVFQGEALILEKLADYIIERQY